MDKIYLKNQKLFIKYLKEYKKKYLPSKYNQLGLFDFIEDEKINHYMSITSRGDGKTFGYFGSMLYLAKKLKFKFIIVVREFEIRYLMFEQLQEIVNTVGFFNIADFTFMRTSKYITVHYKGQELCMILDLNNINDLKFNSAVLSKYECFFIEEFLTLTHEYHPAEAQLLNVLYQSMDRGSNRVLFEKPKAFYLGNPINFDSEIFSYYNIYSILENHKPNTIEVYQIPKDEESGHDRGYMCLEMLANQHINKEKNQSFSSSDDPNIKGSFNFNTYLLNREYLKENTKKVYVKLDKKTLEVYENDRVITLKISNKDRYDYCLNIADKREDVVYLDDKYFSDTFPKKYNKELILFSDSYTKNLVLNDSNLMRLNLYKLQKNESIKENIKEKTLNNISDYWQKRLRGY